MLTDILALATGFVLAEYIGEHSWISSNGINFLFLVIPIYIFVAANQSAYSLGSLNHLGKSLHRTFNALIITVAFLLFAGFFMYSRPMLSQGAMIAGVSATGLLLLAFRVIFYYIVVRRHIGQLTNELIIVDTVSYQPKAGDQILDARLADIEPDLQNPAMINQLAAHLSGVDRVVVACPPERQQAWSLLLKGSNIRGELMLPQANVVGAIGWGKYGETETLVVSHGPLSLRSRARKRMLDLAITVPALLFLTPLLVIVGIAIRLETPGPIFFKQSRIGRSNSVFSILKFRSMRVETSDATGQRSASRDDDRITRVGAFIRRTSIDELPQLINVLRGDMSLVGPRPHALGSLAGGKLFWEVNERYWVRHALKPGITGLAQIRGYRGATVQHEDLENRLRSDLEYVSNWSLWLDIVILFATAKVIKHENAY
ncbi:MAG: exopolysaccharide biosynthesis polyprenyl glycosylphosphotransferase [Sphingobium sp.]|nr:exopolysaccharide biosynthesis polyprenyl glycosylphosphotransferase [Sphingobium sp.]